jgi:phosphate transport system substrate-binding protein
LKGSILKGLAFHRSKVTHLAAAALAVGAAAGFTAVSASAATTSLIGAGSTLVQPLVQDWASTFNDKYGISITYSGVGSGTGIQDITNGTVDFGASDAPLPAGTCTACIQIPWALSATGVGYNISGVGNKLHLSGSVLAGIYLGQITTWDSPQIKALNKGVNLPNLKITPIYRSDGSGDTYAFTNFLSSVSSSFASKVGKGTSVSFPAGEGGKGNSGVTADLEATNGSIAYIAVSYLIAHSIPAVGVRNAAGKFEYPNLKNIENAAQTVKSVPASHALSIVNPPKKAKIAYPISTFTYVIVKPGSPNAAALKQFIDYAIGAGQSYGASLDFAPLPKVVLKADQSAANVL